MFNSWPPPLYSNLGPQSPQLVVLPNTLAKQPQYWSKQEVGQWLNWCVQEYSIEPVPLDKLEMNGKALCLLNRDDFISRLPKNGDLLYNSLQTLVQQNQGNGLGTSLPAYPGIPPTASCMYQQSRLDSMQNNGLIVLSSQKSEHLTEVTQSKPARPIPILPQPTSLTSTSHHYNGSFNQSPAHQRSPDVGKTLNTIPGVLSPAPSGNDSGTDDELTPETDDRDLACDEMQLSHTLAGNYLPNVAILNPDGIRRDSDCRLLWEYIHQLLEMPHKYGNYVCWESKNDFVFRIVNPTGLATLWGQQKNRSNMTYEKLSRALRYYYRMNIIKKVSGRRLTYQFLQPPANIQKGQRGAKPHSRIAPVPIAPAPVPNKKNELYVNSLNSNIRKSPLERPASTGNVPMSNDHTIDLNRTAISLPSLGNSSNDSPTQEYPVAKGYLDFIVPLTSNSSRHSPSGEFLCDIKSENDCHDDDDVSNILSQHNCNNPEVDSRKTCNAYECQQRKSDFVRVKNGGNILSIPCSFANKHDTLKRSYSPCFQTEPEDLSVGATKRQKSVSSPPISCVDQSNSSAIDPNSEESSDSPSLSER